VTNWITTHPSVRLGSDHFPYVQQAFLPSNFNPSSSTDSTSALDGSEWSASRPGHFTPRERAPGTYWIGGWVGRRAVLDAVVKRKIPSPCRESNPRTPIGQPVAQRYTDWDITAHIDNEFPKLKAGPESLKDSVLLRGPFQKFVNWRQCAAVMQRKAVIVMPSCCGWGNVVVVWFSPL
jgi:hypothetical protein